MGLLDLLFPKRNEKIIEALSQGAVIVDVRSAQEYRVSNVNGSVNIPLEQLIHKIGKLKKYKKPIVLCCASGSRSAAAMGILHNAGLSDVHNARSWHRVNHLLASL